MWNHFVFRACTPFEPFQDFETSRKAWAYLTKTFPQMLAGVLMPNHGHLILPHSDSQAEVLNKLYGMMGPISKKMGRAYWQPIPQPHLIPDTFHLHRQVRYVALNPCRKKLCGDPIEWYWSTYREFLGAAAGMPRNPGVLSKALGDLRPGFLDRFHTYVTSDPSVAIKGTSRPTPDLPQIYAYKSIDEILAAAAAALRISPHEVRKKSPLRALFVHLAHKNGWRHRTALLADICGISCRAVRFILCKPAPKGLEAAHLCLSDARLSPKRVTEKFGSKKQCKVPAPLPPSGMRHPSPRGG